MDAELYAYDNLAKEIIIQAIKDYVKALKNLKKERKMYAAKMTIEECRRFFRSKWFCVLSNADGEKMIEKIERNFEHIHFERKHKRKK